MSLFQTAWPFIKHWRGMFPGRVKVEVVKHERGVPLNMAYDAALEELQLEVAKLQQRLHQSKQHAKNVTRQLLELSQEHATLQTECKRAQAEANYWHARCGKHSSESGDVVEPPFS